MGISPLPACKVNSPLLACKGNKLCAGGIHENSMLACRYMNSFEAALFSPTFTDNSTGWRQWANESAFVDWFVLTEVRQQGVRVGVCCKGGLVPSCREQTGRLASSRGKRS